MPCDKFKINSSGKVIIEKDEKTNGITEKIELDILKLPGGKKYIVDKEYLRGLTEYSPETLKNTPIYVWVGANKEETQGITAEIDEIGRLEEFIEEYKKSFK